MFNQITRKTIMRGKCASIDFFDILGFFSIFFCKLKNVLNTFDSYHNIFYGTSYKTDTSFVSIEQFFDLRFVFNEKREKTHHIICKNQYIL